MAPSEVTGWPPADVAGLVAAWVEPDAEAVSAAEVVEAVVVVADVVEVGERVLGSGCRAGEQAVAADLGDGPQPGLAEERVRVVPSA